jgi:hypothetical protein
MGQGRRLAVPAIARVLTCKLISPAGDEGVATNALCQR